MSNKYERGKHAVIAVDVAVFTIINKSLNVLLIQTNKAELKGQWALPGGLVRIDENLDEAVERVLKDKTNITGVLYDQLESFGDPKRDPFGRVVSVAYVALIHADKYLLKTTDQYESIKWQPLKSVPKLAYDHNLITKKGIERLKSKIQYSNLARGILPNEFTLTELQDVYESILDRELDKRNFRKKIQEIGLVVSTGKKETGKKNRPAELFKFKKKSLEYFGGLI